MLSLILEILCSGWIVMDGVSSSEILVNVAMIDSSSVNSECKQKKTNLKVVVR